ncbi:MAG: hypothetical protein IKH00_03975 [Bacteroidales bacterium]|nr:hypothetical protein [Bacteroidales bacterium]
MRIYKLIGWAMAAMSLSLFVLSCEREVILETAGEDQALMISPVLAELVNTQMKTRAIDTSDASYNENKVNRLDVFFFNASNYSFVKAYHTDQLVEEHHGGKTGYMLSPDWLKDGLEKNVPYKVFIVANSTNETVMNTASVTLSSLQSLVREEADIYKRQGSTSDDTYTTTKSFLMNAVVSWTINSSGTQLVNEETVTLQRSAVKFVMDISLSEAFINRLEEGESYGKPSWKFVNFNTRTAEVSGGTAPDPLISTQGSGGYLVSEAGSESGHYTVVTYAYPQSWTSETRNDAAPALLVSYPCTRNGVTAYHYYYIPLCPSTVTATLPNNIYKVNAVISSRGSSEAITVTPTNLNYNVMPWGANNTTDVESEAVDYLVVTPTKASAKGGAGTTSTKFNYYASSDVSIGNVRVFYINKTGAEVDAPASYDYEIVGPSNGQIEIKSTVPTNGTYVEIQFKVYTGTDSERIKEETVTFRHYPTDFVTGLQGAYSTYDLDSWVKPGQRGQNFSIFNYKNQSNKLIYGSPFIMVQGTYSLVGNQDYINNPTYKAPAFFGAKSFNSSDKRIYFLNSDGTQGEYASQTNNRIYVLQLTSSSDNYIIAYPELTADQMTVNGNNITYYTSKDNVISPAFMLASQLGAITGALPTNGCVQNYIYGAIHCALYKEVAVDENGNETKFSGWRLPTKQEISYMIEKQSSSDVMITVLPAMYYWTLDGGVGYNAGGFGNSGMQSKALVRCVRDVTQEELAKLNQF